MAIRSQPLAMGLKPITGLADGVEPQDAATVAQLGGKADLVHTHEIADVDGLQDALDGKEPTIAAGTTSQYWRGDKTWQAFPAQKFARAYVDKYTAWTTISSIIPIDDTPPLISEGDEIIRRSVTVDNATQSIFIDFNTICYSSQYGVFAAFVGSTLVGVVTRYLNTVLSDVSLKAAHTPGAAGTYTVSLRAGVYTSPATLILNGGTGGRYFGGAASIMTTYVIDA